MGDFPKTEGFQPRNDSSMKTIGILNGPNLDRLGKREPAVYGEATLADLERMLRSKAEHLSVKLDFYQSNHEGGLIDKISEWADSGVAGVVFNPGGLTHTSVALYDAMLGSGLPFMEIHISNIYRRESFRHTSYTARASVGVISGMGFHGYLAALRFLAKQGS